MAIQLDNNTVTENVVGAVVGNVSVTDSDQNDSHSFQVSDPRFEVASGKLKLKAGKFLDHESEPTVTVHVTAMDAGGLWLTQGFAITVVDVNEPPSAILVVRENAEGEMIGTLDAIDPDLGDTHVFQALDPRFEVVNGRLKLRAGESLNHETDPTVSIDVIATDGDGESLMQSFVIKVADVNERPVITREIPGQASEENQPFHFTLAADAFADVDEGDRLTFQAALSDGTALPNWLSFDQAARHLSGTPRLGDHGQFSVRVAATDVAGLSGDTTFSITVAADPDPWQNPGLTEEDRMDVDANGVVAAMDVLRVINFINANGSGELPERPAPSEVDHFYVDIDGDNYCNPVDVLQLINHINANAGGGEGESAIHAISHAVPRLPTHVAAGLPTVPHTATQVVASLPTHAVAGLPTVPLHATEGSSAHQETPAHRSNTASPSSPFSPWEKVRMRVPEAGDALPSYLPSALDPQPSAFVHPQLEELLADLAVDVADAFGIGTAQDRLFTRTV